MNTWFNEDITFCADECDNMECRRNQKNIRLHDIPHSFSYFKGTEVCEMTQKDNAKDNKDSK